MVLEKRSAELKSAGQPPFPYWYKSIDVGVKVRLSVTAGRGIREEELVGN